MLVVIDQDISPHSVGTYRAYIQVIDGETDEIVGEFEKFFSRKPVTSVARSTLKDALEMAVRFGGTKFKYLTNRYEHARYATYQNRLRLIDYEQRLYVLKESLDNDDDEFEEEDE